MKKSKSSTGDMSVAASIEEQLKAAGFQTIKAVGEKHIHASGADDFSKAHATFLQQAGKVSACRWDCCPSPVLVVLRPDPEEVADPSAASAPETLNPEPSTDN